MFDKMIFNIRIQFDKEAFPIAERNNLQSCMEGKNVYYKSTRIANFEGITMTVKDGKVQIKCSLHKIYYKNVFNELDNSGLFTMDNAVKALDMLFNTIGVDKERAKITYFEIGLNIPTEHEPIQYIELVKSITTGKLKQQQKEMFNDANFKKYRQKTTEKHKNIKKVFKLYDKGFENADRKRTEPTGEKILRIETMYRRQSIYVSDFFLPDNISKLAKTFYRDWVNVEFDRTITADKGTRQSEISNAKNVLLLGRDEYLIQVKSDFDKGILTAKQYRTIREFIRDWENNKHKYRALPTKHEKEYKEKLWYMFNLSKH